MANPYSVGNTVLVPAGLLSNRDERSYAYAERSVLQVGAATVTVADFDSADAPEHGTKRIRVDRVHPGNLGVLVLRVGDLGSEDTLLDPLAKSMTQFLRLLLPDDRLWHLSLRTWTELSAYWTKYHARFTHVVLVSHAGTDGVDFLDRPGMSGTDFGRALEALAPDTPAKVFLSLACQTGRAPFLKGLSESRIASACIAPFHKVHGAVASQFCQAFMVFRLLEGDKIEDAHGRPGPRS